MTASMNAIAKSGEVGRPAGQRGETGAKGSDAFDEAFAQVGRESGGKPAKERSTAMAEAGQRPDGDEARRAGIGERQPAVGSDAVDLVPRGAGNGATPAGAQPQPEAPRASPGEEAVQPPSGESRGDIRAGTAKQPEGDVRAAANLPRTSDGRLDLAELLGGKNQAAPVMPGAKPEDIVEVGTGETEQLPGTGEADGSETVATATMLPVIENAAANAQQAPAASSRDWAATLTVLSSGAGARGVRAGEAVAGRTELAGGEPGNAAAMPEGEGDELFRFAEANAKAENVPGLSSAERLRAALAAMVREPGGAEAPAAAGVDVEANAPAFSIIESRKFLGVATGQTAVASVVSAVTENAEWNAMLREAPATAATTLNTARNAANTLKIQLSPVELGTVTATLKMSGGNLSIELQVETIEAYRQLSSDQHSLVRALRGHGYDIEQVVLHQPPSGERGQTVSATAATSNMQGGGGQPASSNGEGNQAGNGQQRGGEAGRDGQHHHQGERRGENGGMAGERNRPGGGVYL